MSVHWDALSVNVFEQHGAGAGEVVVSGGAEEAGETGLPSLSAEEVAVSSGTPVDHLI